MIRNKQVSETELVNYAVARLGECLPASWRLEIETPPRGRTRPDAYLKITSPSRSTGTLAVEAIGQRTASYLRYVLEIMRKVRAELPDATPLAVAPYFSPSIRAALTRNAIGYADATGNLRLSLDMPALFILMTGADRDPSPDDQPLRSLRGGAAGRALRAFCDFRPPYGTRELAERAGVPASTISRVADLLEREGILRRERSRGPIVETDWQAALRRWTQDYSFVRSNRTSEWIEPRGLQALTAKLRETGLQYALTGSLAANAIAPITVPRLAALYLENAEAAAAELGLRPAETGANVLLAEPFDAVVFTRSFQREGLYYTAYSQVATDLLTGPGRWPAEGEAVLDWMQTNESVWRA